MQIEGCCFTNIGTTREINQDAIIFINQKKQKGNFALGAICDGIGGLEHGEVASGIVCDGLAKWYEDVKEWIDIKKVDETIIYCHLKDTIEVLNQKVLDYYKANGVRTGTTMSLIMILRQKFYIIQVGDSRIYRYRKHLQQLTEDETIVDYSGERCKKYLANFMGKAEVLKFSSVTGKIRAGDHFLFCSDGLYHRLLESDFDKKQLYYASTEELHHFCHDLVENMKERGETDNLSAGLIIIKGGNKLKNLFQKK